MVSTASFSTASRALLPYGAIRVLESDGYGSAFAKRVSRFATNTALATITAGCLPLSVLRDLAALFQEDTTMKHARSTIFMSTQAVKQAFGEGIDLAHNREDQQKEQIGTLVGSALAASSILVLAYLNRAQLTHVFQTLSHTVPAQTTPSRNIPPSTQQPVASVPKTVNPMNASHVHTHAPSVNDCINFIGEISPIKPRLDGSVYYGYGDYTFCPLNYLDATDDKCWMSFFSKYPFLISKYAYRFCTYPIKVSMPVIWPIFSVICPLFFGNQGPTIGSLLHPSRTPHPSSLQLHYLRRVLQPVLAGT